MRGLFGTPPKEEIIIIRRDSDPPLNRSNTSPTLLSVSSQPSPPVSRNSHFPFISWGSNSKSQATQLSRKSEDPKLCELRERTKGLMCMLVQIVSEIETDEKSCNSVFFEAIQSAHFLFQEFYDYQHSTPAPTDFDGREFLRQTVSAAFSEWCVKRGPADNPEDRIRKLLNQVAANFNEDVERELLETVCTDVKCIYFNEGQEAGDKFVKNLYDVFVQEETGVEKSDNYKSKFIDFAKFKDMLTAAPTPRKTIDLLRAHFQPLNVIRAVYKDILLGGINVDEPIEKFEPKKFSDRNELGKRLERIRLIDMFTRIPTYQQATPFAQAIAKKMKVYLNKFMQIRIPMVAEGLAAAIKDPSQIKIKDETEPIDVLNITRNFMADQQQRLEDKYRNFAVDSDEKTISYLGIALSRTNKTEQEFFIGKLPENYRPHLKAAIEQSSRTLRYSEENLVSLEKLCCDIRNAAEEIDHQRELEEKAKAQEAAATDKELPKTAKMIKFQGKAAEKIPLDLVKITADHIVLEQEHGRLREINPSDENQVIAFLMASLSTAKKAERVRFIAMAPLQIRETLTKAHLAFPEALTYTSSTLNALKDLLTRLRGTDIIATAKQFIELGQQAKTLGLESFDRESDRDAVHLLVIALTTLTELEQKEALNQVPLDVWLYFGNFAEELLEFKKKHSLIESHGDIRCSVKEKDIQGVIDLCRQRYSNVAHLENESRPKSEILPRRPRRPTTAVRINSAPPASGKGEEKSGD